MGVVGFFGDPLCEAEGDIVGERPPQPLPEQAMQHGQPMLPGDGREGENRDGL